MWRLQAARTALGTARSAESGGARFFEERTKSALLPMTAAQGIYDAVVFAQLMPFTLSGTRFEELGWPRPLGRTGPT